MAMNKPGKPVYIGKPKPRPTKPGLKPGKPTNKPMPIGAIKPGKPMRPGNKKPIKRPTTKPIKPGTIKRGM